MPEQPGSGDKPDLPQHVKDYFSRRDLDPEDLPQHTRAKLARFTPNDVKALDRVGEGLESDAATAEMYVFVIH
jgi:hypothetical protein